MVIQTRWSEARLCACTRDRRHGGTLPTHEHPPASLISATIRYKCILKELITLQPRDRGRAPDAYSSLIHDRRPDQCDHGGYRCSRPDPPDPDFVNVGTFLASEAAS